MRRKILSFLLVFCMVLTLLPASALATEVDGEQGNEPTAVSETENTQTGDETPVTEEQGTQVAKIGETTYTSLNAAFEAVTDSNPATITLTADATITECITIATSKDITLDIGSHNISVPANTTDLWKEGKVVAMFSVSGKLTIKGSGAITAKTNDSYVINVAGGTCALEGTVTYTGNVSVVQAQTGTLTVAGGTFKLAQKAQTYNDSRYMLNCIDANYKNNTAKIEVTGGTFENFDPGSNLAEGTGTNFLKEGYESKTGADSTTYTVAVKTETEDPTPAAATVSISKYTGSDNFWGHTASDMGEITSVEKAEDGTYKVTGSAKYISNYTGFNPDTNEQNGHYLPINIAVTLPEGESTYGNVTVKGAKEKELTIDNTGLQLVMFLDNLTDSKFTVKYGADTYTVDVSDVTLLPNTGTDTKVEPNSGEGATGVVAKPSGDASGDTTAVTIPEVNDLSKMTITISKVTEKNNVVPSEANVNDAVKTAITGENSTIVAVTVKKDNHDVFGENNTVLTDGQKITVTIGGLTTARTYYVFCITDNAVTYCGEKELTGGATSIEIKTTHLSSWVAVEKTDELANEVGSMTKDSAEVTGGTTEPEVTPVTVTYQANGSNPFASLKVSGLDTLTSGAKYIMQISKVGSTKSTDYTVIELTPSNGEATVLVLDNTGGYNVTLYTLNGTALTAVTGYGSPVKVTPAPAA